MSSGPLVQLASLGRQDTNLIVNPNVTFWKTVFKKHTHFAMEPVETPTPTPVTWDSENIVPLVRNGDLIRRIFLKVKLGKLPTGWYYTEDIGRAMFETIQLKSGTVVIDTMYPEFTHAWEELTVDEDRQLGSLTGKFYDITTNQKAAAAVDQILYIPLDFWFCKENGMALPIVTAFLTELKLHIKTNPFTKLIINGNGDQYVNQPAPSLSLSLIQETVYLESAERDWFAQSGGFYLEYLIEQRQNLRFRITSTTADYKTILRFSHPVKELMFLFRQVSKTASGVNEWFNFEGNEDGADKDAFKNLKLLINSNDRIKPMDPAYFRILQPYMHHTRIPTKNIYVYSFALNPEDAQPSGHINFSRINEFEVMLTFSGANGTIGVDTDMLVFAINYNTITFKDGVVALTWAS